MSEFVIRRLTAEEMEQMITNCIKFEGWTESYDVLDAFRILDHDGFFGGFLNGKLIGHISCVRYEDNYGFVGYYFVTPEYRKQGFGIQLWREGMRHLAGCNIGLDGVAEEVPLYEKSGFTTHCQNYRYRGISAVMPADPHVVPYQENLLSRVAEYDTQCFPSRRRDFLSAWLTVAHGHAVVYLEDGVVRGFAAMHHTENDSNEIAPCFADSREIARALYVGLINQLGDGVRVHWNIPGDNQDALVLLNELTEYRPELCWDIARMYTNGAPQVRTDKVWSMTSYSTG